MNEYILFAIIFELVLWIIIIVRGLKHGLYKAILVADFVVTTIDFVLLLTPFRTVLFYIILFKKGTRTVLVKIPVTLGMVFLVKTVLFYLGQEVFPQLPRELDTLFSDREVIDNVEKHRL